MPQRFTDLHKLDITALSFVRRKKRPGGGGGGTTALFTGTCDRRVSNGGIPGREADVRAYIVHFRSRRERRVLPKKMRKKATAGARKKANRAEARPIRPQITNA